MMKRKHSSSSEARPRGKRSRSEEEPDHESREDEEENEIELSQLPDFNYNPTMGDEADVGIIEQVTLKNFMCHTRLDVPFGPKVNYIIGRNGSGKSAIMTGLVVGLGGKATATSRGSSIKSFIKSGKQSAEISVRLRNRGTDAFKHELYGDSVIVERRISAEGSSSYKLKSKSGKLISGKREELNYLLDQLNIQVDNPVAILNQDTSRNFLHSKSPNDKYKFFLKATQLEQMKHDYSHADESKRVAKGILAQKSETLPELQSEVSEWEQKFKALESVKKLKEKVQRLKQEMAWAFVCGKEKEAEPYQKSLKMEEARTPKYLQKVEEFQGKVANKEQAYRNIEEEIKTLNVTAKEIEPQFAEAKRNKDEKKSVHRTMQIDVQKTKRDIVNIQKLKSELLQRIEELRNSNQQDHESERRERERRIGELSEEKNAIEASMKTTLHEIDQFKRAVAKYKEDQYALRGEMNEVKRQTDQKSKRLKDLESSRSNRLRIFGHFVPEILQRIELAHKQGRFHKKPVGPIGALITLKDTRYSLAVENCLKSLLQTFCIHDHHDEKVLETIFDQVCPSGKRPPTVVSKFLPTYHDVSKFKVRSQFPTLLDMLEIDNPVVSNCLVDQRGIECILLIGDEKQARETMSTNPPKNTKEAFTLRGDQLYCHPTFRYYSCPFDKAKLLTTDVEDEIRQCKEDLNLLHRKQSDIDGEYRKLTQDIRSNMTQENRLNTQVHKLREHVTKLTFEIGELRNVEDPEPVDIATLEEEVQQHEESLVSLKEKQQKLTVNTEEAKRDLEGAEQAFKELDEKRASISENVDIIKEKLANAENEIDTAKEHKKHYERKLKEHEKKVEETKKIIQKKQEELELDIEKATRICPRVQTKRSAANIEGEINQINRQIESEESKRGNHEEITRTYHEKFTAFKKIKKEVHQLENFLKKLKDALDQRKEAYTVLRTHLCTRIKLRFTACLYTKQYAGKLIVNHRNGTINFYVQPTVSDSGHGAKDMKALSGGERSFSTVCFILALWDAMESPFRCLDEFDVFMDMVNRRISMEMMMKVARQQKGRQFIFLTPQDMSSTFVNPAEDRIFKMPDPERGQGILPFRPVGQEEDDD